MSSGYDDHGGVDFLDALVRAMSTPLVPGTSSQALFTLLGGSLPADQPINNTSTNILTVQLTMPTVGGAGTPGKIAANYGVFAVFLGQFLWIANDTLRVFISVTSGPSGGTTEADYVGVAGDLKTICIPHLEGPHAPGTGPWLCKSAAVVLGANGNVVCKKLGQANTVSTRFYTLWLPGNSF